MQASVTKDDAMNEGGRTIETIDMISRLHSGML